MSFMLKKKKYKFQVDLLLEELSSVPYVNAILFAKVRLLDGGSFSEMSPREEVKDHCVKWGARCLFNCKMSANAITGVLEPCTCRVSVRKEVKGGRSFQKLGFADLNLAEFAGAGKMPRRYLLEGYDAKHRQDNSILKVTLIMTLLSGDPCFKAPSFTQPTLKSEKPEDHFLSKKVDDGGESVASGSTGFGSLPRKQKSGIFLSEGEETEDKKEESTQDFELGHSRNPSQQSRASGYSSLHSHSRQGSFESGHLRNLSTGSSYSDMVFPGQCKSIDRKRPSAKKQITDENRMDSTRVNAGQVIDELFEGTNLKADELTETGLKLIIGKDGTAVLGSCSLKSSVPGGNYEEVVIDNR